MRRLVLIVAVAACVVCSSWGGLVAGQATGPPDGPGDDLNCGDFRSYGGQPAAQANLNASYPEDPNGLDKDHDWIACENEFNLTPEEEAAVVPANVAARSSNPRGVESPPAAPAPNADSRIEPSQEILDAVAGCATVAIGTRRVTASGCTDGRNVLIRLPDDAPPMRRRAYTQWVMPIPLGGSAPAVNVDIGGRVIGNVGRSQRAGSKRQQQSIDAAQAADDGKQDKRDKKAKRDRESRKRTTWS